MDKITTKYQNFRTHVERRLKQQEGWEVEWGSVSYPTFATFVCPHGDEHEETLFPEAMKSTPDLKGMADRCYRKALKFCKDDHAEIMPIQWLTDPAYVPFPTYKIYAGLTEFNLSAPLTFHTHTFTFGGGGNILAELSKVAPVLNEVINVKCPVCKTTISTLGSMVPHINDTHKWKREKIAKWLETLDVDLTIKPKKESDDEPATDAGYKGMLNEGFNLIPGGIYEVSQWYSIPPAIIA